MCIRDRYEAEDSIVDFEKLTRSSGKLTLPDDELTKKIDAYTESIKRTDDKKQSLTKNIALYREKKDIKTASVAYRDIRDLTKMLLSSSTATKKAKDDIPKNVVAMTSTKAGIGARFDVEISNMPIGVTTIRDVAATLRKGGSKERADLLDKIADNIKIIDDYMGERTVKEKNKARQSLMNDIPKLNKGGLVSRRS